MFRKQLKIFLLVCVSLILTASVRSQQVPVPEVHINRAQPAPFSETLLQQLKLPQGFTIHVFAKDLGKPRMLAVLPNGGVLATRPETGDVVLLEDQNKDGKAEAPRVVASGLEKVHGIAIRQNQVYLATVKEILVSDIQQSGISSPRAIVKDLPDGGQHHRRSIEFGKDGMMYVSIGSSCNDCNEADEEHAAILRFAADGTGRKVFAKGLRNTIGYGWHPQTGEMWGMDHGNDYRGDTIPPEELNQLKEGANYGWPLCFAKQQPDPLRPDPPGSTKAEYCKTTLPSTLEYDAHASPIDLVFYTGAQFPDYKEDAFVAFHGSWNRTPPSGYKIVRINFENGKPVAFEDFITGFLMEGGEQFISRPAGLAQGSDGSLFISDDGNGVIYKVTYGRK
jgi:glucose/arabinose dehydrogenase